MQLVKEIDNLDDIWERLKMSFGSVTILLSKELEEIEKGVPKIRDDEKIIQAVMSIKNSMMELSSLANKSTILSIICFIQVIWQKSIIFWGENAR